MHGHGCGVRFFGSGQLGGIESTLAAADVMAIGCAWSSSSNTRANSETAHLASGAGQELTIGRVFAHLHHDGDLAAAAL